MKRSIHRSWFAFLLLVAGTVGGCFLEQKLDENAASGSKHSPNSTAQSGTGGSGPTGVGGDNGSSTTGASGSNPGSTGSGGSNGLTAAACAMTRAEARSVLRSNCAGCHEKPNNQANFNFILDLDKLMSGVASTGQKFVVGGDPAHSRIYQRMSSGEMPPAMVKMPRPVMNDIAVVATWITSCYEDSQGWEAPDGGDGLEEDAGAQEAGPPPGCGNPGQSCCTANVCNGGGCCVFGQCRASGQTCTAAAGGIGLFGTCSSGTCKDSMGATCGDVAQPCCDNSTCTASRASCLVGMTTCSACGGDGQPCCKNGSAQNCLEGNACVGAGVGRTGNCQVCGGLDQPCCGIGVAAQKTCSGDLHCAPVSGMGDRCGAGADE